MGLSYNLPQNSHKKSSSSLVTYSQAIQMDNPGILKRILLNNLKTIDINQCEQLKHTCENLKRFSLIKIIDDFMSLISY